MKPEEKTFVSLKQRESQSFVTNEKKYPNEKEDFFQYMDYLLYEDSEFTLKEVAWLRRTIYKFMDLKPIHEKENLFYKKELLFDDVEFTNMGQQSYFRGFLSSNP